MPRQILMFILIFQFASLSAFALTEATKKLVFFETQANGAARRLAKTVKLPHYEIPLKYVGADFAKRIDKKILNSLIFHKNGETYIRWILNPEDTHWKYQVREHFARKGIKLKEVFYFEGYQTASRSYIAEDPASHIQFSVKSSTDTTGGAWRDKKQPVGEAIDSRIISDFLYEQNQLRPFKYFTFMDEPAVYGISEIDQAVVIRDIGELKNEKSEFIYLPAFSALHEIAGKEIALKNGSNDPYKFWTEHYIRQASLAVGELAGRTGLQFDSPHSQNFLIELDTNLKPTGRIILRDMADFYLDTTILDAMNFDRSPMSKKLLNKFTQNNNRLNYIAAGLGPLHGNIFPSWVTNSNYDQWNDVFLKNFNLALAETTEVPLSVFSKIKSTRSNKYFGATYTLSQMPELWKHFENLQENGYVKENYTYRCERLFSK